MQTHGLLFERVRVLVCQSFSSTRPGLSVCAPVQVLPRACPAQQSVQSRVCCECSRLRPQRHLVPPPCKRLAGRLSSAQPS